MKKTTIYNLIALMTIFTMASCQNKTSNISTNSKDNSTEKAEEYTIRYMQNDGTDKIYKEETIKMKPSVAYINAAPNIPQRDGYKFAGWQTKAEVDKDDLMNGVSPYEWRFGKKLSTLGKAKFSEMTEEVKQNREISSGEMLIKNAAVDNVLTLYARWNEKTEISNASELQNMKDDLYGWYVLSDDIDLNNVNFEPIGAYFSSYEFYETSWWTYAFRGTLDGNDHTISGLKLSKATYDKNYKETKGSVWNEDGVTCDGNAALFSAISSGEIKNLTLQNFDFDVTYSGDFCYVGALAAFDMGSTLTDVYADNISIKMTYSDSNQKFRNGTGMFAVAGGLEAGSWSTKVINCSTKGTVKMNLTNVDSHGGEIYLGGLFGENYSSSSHVITDVNLNLSYSDESKVKDDLSLNVNVGGIGGAATGVNPYDENKDNKYSNEEIKSSSSSTKSIMNIDVSKPVGESKIAIGGACGAKRYDLIQYTNIESDITLTTNLDSSKGNIYIGKVAGMIDIYYTLQILCYTNLNKAGSKSNNCSVTCNNETVTTPIALIPDGLNTITYEGEQVSAIVNGKDMASAYSCNQNIDEIISKYSSYVSKSTMSSGIIIIYNED